MQLTETTVLFIGSSQVTSNSKDTFVYIYGDSISQVPQSLKTVTVTNETNVPENAFKDCEYIETININDSISTIGNSAFDGCKALKSFNVPNGIKTIGNYTFRNCENAVKITIPDTVNDIGISAFEGCKSIKEINIPDGVKSIENDTFRNCSSLVKIEIPTSVKSIGENVLQNCNKIINLKIPFIGSQIDLLDSTVSPEEKVFGYIFGVANDRVPAAVTRVEITGKDKNMYILSNAFKNCLNIEDIVIDGSRSIGASAFADCRRLKNVYIPKSVDNISGKIFEGCTQIETIVVPFIGINRQDNNTETSVLGAFFGWYEDETSDEAVAKGVRQYYDNSYSNLASHLYKIPLTLKNVSVLNQTNIPAGAFSESSVVNVSIVSGVKMNDYVFYHCSELKKVLLPNNMEIIGKYAFAECESLETINIPSQVETIGSHAFYNARNIKSIVMPDSIKEIASDIFKGTNLVEMNDVSLMSSTVTFTCSEGSVAYQFAVKNGISVNLVDSSELDVKTVGANISKLSTNEWLVDVAADGEKFEGTVYAALYDSNGKMIAVKGQKTQTTESEYRLMFAESETKNAASAKVFVWGGTNGLTPLTTTPTTPDLPA